MSSFKNLACRASVVALIALTAVSIPVKAQSDRPVYLASCDINADGIINSLDVSLVQTNVGPINAANSHMDLDGNLRIDAFDMQKVAQRSGAARAPDPELNFDVNRDGSIDTRDLDALLQHMRPAPYRAEYDFTRDGKVDAFDLQAIANQLSHTRTIVIDPVTRVGTRFDMAGNNSNADRHLSYPVNKNGWSTFRRDQLDPVVAAGVARFEFHNIFGRRSRDVPMDFPIWDELVRTMEPITSDFVSVFSDFHQDNPHLHTIAYIGSPHKTPELRALEGNPDAWWNTVLDTLVPLLQAGFRNIGIDASGGSTIGNHPLDLLLYDVLIYANRRDPIRHRRLLDVIGSQPIGVYFEATPMNYTDPKTGLYTDRSAFGHTNLIINDYDYYLQDPDRSGTHPSRKRHSEHYIELDEINVIVRHESCKPLSPSTPRAHCLESVRALLSEPYGNVITLLNSRNLVSLDGNQAFRGHSTQSSLRGFINELNLPSLPVRVDLDLSNGNPVTTSYRITQAPRNGSIAMSEHDADVVVYTPRSHFKGTDYLEYTASVNSRTIMTGRINFDVR